MDCYVCRAEGHSSEDGAHIRVECSRCGVYAISKGAIRLIESGLALDVDSTRRWIASYRDSERPPMMATTIVRSRQR